MNITITVPYTTTSAQISRVESALNFESLYNPSCSGMEFNVATGDCFDVPVSNGILAQQLYSIVLNAIDNE